MKDGVRQARVSGVADDVAEMLAAENAELRDQLETAKWYRRLAKEAIEQIRGRDLEIERQGRQIASLRGQNRRLAGHADAEAA